MPRKVLTTLDLNGPLNLTGNAGTSGQILISGGSGAPTWTSSPNLNNPLLSSISTVGGGGSEGGQINFARVTDGAAYWYIDSFGSTASPDLRFIENATERFRIAAGGVLYVNGSAGTNGQVLTSSGTGSAPTWTTVSGGSFTGGTLTSDLVLAAGSTTVKPLTFQANSSTPTVTAGAWDYDGDKFSAVTSGTATGRLMVPVTAWAFSNANATQATGTTAQSIFPTGARTLPLEANKTYYFKLVLAWSHAWTSGGPNTGRLEPTFVNAPQEINYVLTTITSGAAAFTNRATATGATNYTPSLSSNGVTGTTTVEGFFRSNATTGGTIEFKYSTSSGGTGGFTMLAGCFEQVIKLGSGANSPLAISGTWS